MIRQFHFAGIPIERILLLGKYATFSVSLNQDPTKTVYLCVAIPESNLVKLPFDQLDYPIDTSLEEILHCGTEKC